MDINTLTEAPQVEAEFHQKKPVKKRNRFLKFRIAIAVLIFGLFTIAGIFVISVMADLPPLDAIENPRTQLSTQIYTADGELLRSFYSEEHRISVKLADVSPHVLDALIATEDLRFYKHSGIDPNAFFAILKDKLSGKKTRGGSTITMQLARNLYDQVGRERTLIRKLKEMVVAVILEKKFTKEEIMEGYLNTVSFVGNTYGIQNGAQHYFHKNASDLQVEEAALLVGLLKGTNQFNPRKNPKASLNRRNTILQLMAQNDLLEPRDQDSILTFNLDSLKALPLLIKDKKNINDLGVAPYFTEHLRQWAKAWCDTNGYDLYKDGLRIYTTLDSRMQGYAEKSVRTHLSELQPKFDKHIKGREAWRKDSTILVRAMQQSYRYVSLKQQGYTREEINKNFRTPIPMTLFTWEKPIDTVISPWDSIKHYSRFLETGFVAIDPHSGHIKAWVGGIDHLFFKYDHVYTGKRQVGSTFKPFVYTTAFDNGMVPCDKELNQPVFFYNDRDELIWSPKNADGKIGGFMTLRRGLATSTNMITARVMKKVGPELVCRYAKDMGIESPLECVPSLALGTTDLSVFELTGAYCTFVNNGVYNRPIFVTRIEDQNGNILQEFSSESREAIKKETAYLMLDMLMGVVNEPGGTAGRLRFRHKIYNQVGGKTGTTQNHSDGWFMGVTPHLVAGTWVGCSSRKMRFRSLQYGQGASLALPIFGNFMSDVYADSTIGIPKDDFQKPPGFDIELDCVKYDLKKKSTPFSGDSLFFQGTKSIMDPDNEL